MYYFYITIAILTILLVFSSTQFIKFSRAKLVQKRAVEAYQAENQLSDSELEIFKTEMTIAKSHLDEIEKIIASHQKLKQNKKIMKSLNHSKIIFIYLMDNPKELIVYDKFLYRNLPSFRMMLTKYISEMPNSFEVLSSIYQNINEDFRKVKQEKIEAINQIEEFIK